MLSLMAFQRPRRPAFVFKLKVVGVFPSPSEAKSPSIGIFPVGVAIRKPSVLHCPPRRAKQRTADHDDRKGANALVAGMGRRWSRWEKAGAAHQARWLRCRPSELRLSQCLSSLSRSLLAPAPRPQPRPGQLRGARLVSVLRSRGAHFAPPPTTDRHRSSEQAPQVVHLWETCACVPAYG